MPRCHDGLHRAILERTVLFAVSILVNRAGDILKLCLRDVKVVLDIELTASQLCVHRIIAQFIRHLLAKEPSDVSNLVPVTKRQVVYLVLHSELVVAEVELLPRFPVIV